LFFKGVIIVAAIILGVIFAMVIVSDYESSQEVVERTEIDSQKIIELAQDFITTSPTFSYDGVSDSLEIEVNSLETGSEFFVKGKFKTTHIGYGNRTSLVLAEDIILHTIELVIVEEKIISAIIDNRWDELNQITCTAASC
jgi:hypothetical protein